MTCEKCGAPATGMMEGTDDTPACMAHGGPVPDVEPPEDWGFDDGDEPDPDPEAFPEPEDGQELDFTH